MTKATFTYFRRASSGLHPLYAAGLVVADDDTATVHYYGTVTLSAKLSPSEVAMFDLVEADDEALDEEAEADRLYDREMRL